MQTSFYKGRTWLRRASCTFGYINFGKVNRYTDREQSHVIVVNEAYPARCIDFHLLVDPTQKQYVVQGYIAPASHVTSAIPPPTNISTGLSQISDESLQLKPPGKSVRAREPATPSRSEETPNSSTNHGDHPTMPQESSEGDDLDVATWEIIQADHLVITNQKYFYTSAKPYTGYRRRGSHYLKHTRLAKEVSVHG